MAHDASNNNPAKETVHALIGIVVLLTIISSIAISAWFRPAGNHELATTPATVHGKALEEKLQAIDAPKAEDPKAQEATAEAAKPAEDKTSDKADEAKPAEAESNNQAEAKADDKGADKAAEPKTDSENNASPDKTPTDNQAEAKADDKGAATK